MSRGGRPGGEPDQGGAPERVAVLERVLRRERQARQQAEALLEEKSAELFRASEELRRQYEYLANVLRSIADGIALTDTDGRVVRVNRAMRRLAGLETGQGEGLSIDALVDLPGRSLGDMLALQAGGPDLASAPVEGEAVSRDGSRRPVDVVATPLVGDDGKAQGCVVSVRDISHRRETEAQLEKLYNAVEQIADSVMITDREGRIEYANPAFETATGYAFDEIVGRPPSFLKSGRHEDGFYRHMWETILAGEVYRDVLINCRKDGTEYYSEKTITPLRNTHGEITHFVSSDRDVTERRRLEAQVIQSEKLAGLGQLAAGVAHEINNPVGYVMSNLESLAEYAGGIRALLGKLRELRQASSSGEAEEEHRRLMAEVEEIWSREDVDYILDDLTPVLDESREGARRVRDIVQNLKNFARADEGEMREADVNQGIEETLRVVWNELKYKAKVTKELGSVPPIRCHAGQLNQVFMNMLVNAAQAIDKSGEITVRSALDGDQVVVRISDTGRGIPPNVLGRVFDPFYTTKEVGQGTGLGLSISHGIVEKHGGRIEVASEVGKGTTFTISLPLGGPPSGSS